ncbi:MAG: MFS transporter [Solirubrobacteraceae bacterium]|nr:MFS transporter [Solirubrobacteraceae bacterium]
MGGVPTDPPRMPRRLVALLALTCGATVANLWYVTPLLNEIADGFGTSQAAAGLLVTAVQAGYVLGLAFLVPLADRHERRGLIVRVLAATGLAGAACAAAPSMAALLVALLALGLTAAVAQMVVPLASLLAGPGERGRVVGIVMSGLLVGILAARTVAGGLAELGGWRLVFALGAALTLTLALVLRRALPRVEPAERIPYGALLRSILTLVRTEPVLRQRMALGALAMAGFSLLWTALAFLLGDPPYGYSEGVIGLFGIAGLAGILIAPQAGRWADRGHGRTVLAGFLVLVVASWGLLAAGRSSLAALIAGIVLFDLAIQGQHIANQSAIYALHPEARGRLTTAYMVSYFLGGTAGTLAAAAAWALDGWTGVSIVGAGLGAAALAVLAATRRIGAGEPVTSSG